jgi:hypothetical protein
MLIWSFQRDGDKTEIGEQLYHEIHVRAEQVTFRRNGTSVNKREEGLQLRQGTVYGTFLRPPFLEGRKA